MYVSIDIETTGPIPGPHSMIQLGATTFTKDKIGNVFQVELKELTGSDFDPDTKIWWGRQGDALEKIQKNQVEITTALEKFRKFLKEQMFAFGDFSAIPVCYPAAFDWMFIRWYLVKFKYDGIFPFGMSAIDLKSYASAKLDIPFNKCVKRAFPEKIKSNLPQHTHEAGQDSLEQAVMFQRILNV